jgi:ABC-type dipeptide/oligopeptide/nickel transport system ATPase component
MGAILKIQDLAVSFANADLPRLRAVDGVSLSVHAGQTLAVVGESGSGKSVTAMSVLGLLPPHSATIERGKVLWSGAGPERDLLRLSPRELRPVRGGQIAMIFQEPMTSLNPVFTIGEQIAEAVRLHQRASPGAAREAAARALEEVGISGALDRLRQYPHEFSGGMRQRVMIAMALACRPKLLLADEPTTALDVTVQKQILGLLRDAQRERSMGMLLVTHDMTVVASAADVVCVMYAGHVVEYTSVFELFARPLHPYTRGLLACVPSVASRAERLRTVQEILADESQWRPLTNGARPWWTNAPATPDAAYRLAEVEPGRWVGVLGGPPSRWPDLDFRRTGADTPPARPEPATSG